MMDIRTIQMNSRNAGIKAAKDNMQPYEMWEGDVNTMPPFPFPFIGDLTPDGWEKVNEFFVDSSGMGAQGEGAMTAQEFMKEIKVGYGYAITQQGQFQVYVGEFKLLRS